MFFFVILFKAKGRYCKEYRNDMRVNCFHVFRFIFLSKYDFAKHNSNVFSLNSQ